MTVLYRDLEKLGLTEKEARVYCALLELGSASTKEIAAKVTIGRPATYLVLEALTKRGLANSIEEAGTIIFTAEHPKQLELILQRSRAKLAEQEVILHDLEPELAGLFHHASNQPAVKIYTGTDGFLAMDKDSFRHRRRGKTAYSFTALDLLGTYQSKTNSNHYAEKRMHFREPLQVIYTHKDGPQPGATDAKLMREARFVPRNKYPFEGSIVIRPWYGLRIFSHRREQFLGITIASKELAKTMESIFKLVWDSLEKG